MAHGGDHRDIRRGDRSGDDFFVERPEVFDRSSPAPRNDCFDFSMAIEPLDRRDDFPRRLGALHAARRDIDFQVREPPPQDIQHVAQGGARRRSDNADSLGQHRQDFLALGREQSFGLKFLFQFLEALKENTEPGLQHAIGDDLVLPARLVNGYPSTDDNLLPVLDLEFDAGKR